MYQRPTAPLSIGGVLDDGFRLLKACFGNVIGLAIIASIVGNLPNFMSLGMTPEEAAATMGRFWWLVLLSFPLSVILFGAILARICAVADNQDMTFGGALGVGTRRSLALFGWMLAYGASIMVGSLMLLIPGIIFAVTLAFAPYLIVAEGQGVVEATRNSHRLVWGNWWRTAALMTIIVFIFVAVYALIAVLSAVGVVAEGGDADPGLVVYVFIVLANALITPVMYAMWLSIFNDLRLRRDGADLEQRLGDIEAT